MSKNEPAISETVFLTCTRDLKEPIVDISAMNGKEPFNLNVERFDISDTECQYCFQPVQWRLTWLPN